MRHNSYMVFLQMLAVSGSVLLAACGGSSSTHPSATIASLGWYEENLDPSFWSTAPTNGQTAFYDFWIHYSGEISFGDIQYARVYLPSGGYWTINVDSTYFDATNHFIGGFGRWYGSEQVNVLPIGDLQVELKLNGGSDVWYTGHVPAPASSTAGAYTTMYTQDVAAPPAASAPMLVRATIGTDNTATAASQTLSITFSVADSKVHDGFVWFYDASDTYLGGFFYFRDESTGLVRSQLGGSLTTDGTTNTVTLVPADLTLNDGVSFNQIARFRVVLTDGAQYGAATGRLKYDCRSVSAVASLVWK